MQFQETPLLDRFRASRPFTLSVGRCARIAGASRPFLVTEWNGPEFEVSCLAGGSLDISTRPVNEVSLIDAKGACAVLAAITARLAGSRGQRHD